MDVTERALTIVFQLAFIGRIRGKPDPQIVSAAGFQGPEGRHCNYLRSGRGRYG